MAKQQTDQTPFIKRGLNARSQARKTGWYISSDQVVAELTLMLKQAQQAKAAKSSLESLPR